MPPARALLVGALLAAGAFAGCVADPLTGASTAPDPNAVLGAVSLLDEGGFRMDVPIDVYLLGFSAETAAALQAKLEPVEVDHSAGSFDRAFPPDPSATPLGGPYWRSPTQPRAVFRVVDLDEATESSFLSSAASWKVPESEAGAYDANAAEAWLAQRLADLRGAPLDRGAPVFVILHAGDALGEHAWRYAYSHGYLEPIRVFGELEPLTVFDASAQPDPYVVGEDKSPTALAFGALFGPAEAHRYDWPVEAPGDETVEVLHELIVDAAHWRFLKGPIYPISTKPCHHVTLLLAVHATTATEALPGFRKAKEWVDVEGLEGAFENLTGDEVAVELKTYALPQDEPVLDALTRGAGSFATLDALRWYLDENFEKFVTPQEGCEEYLSLLLYGDAATVGTFGGIGTYDVQRSHRISFSLVSDATRVRNLYEGPGREVVNNRDPSRVQWNLVNLLYSHETGHLFGQHHPQHLTRTSEPSPTNHAFEAVYSVMSYQTDDKTIDFGAVDFATWTRGRVGYTIAEAQALGLDGTPEFQAALDHLAMGHWTAAHLSLEALVQDAAKGEGGAALPAYHLTEWHAHPWG